MKKYLPLVSVFLLILSILGLAIIYGCGTTTSGGGGGEISTAGCDKLGGYNIITISHAGTSGLSILNSIPSKTITGKVREIMSGNPIANVLLMVPAALGGYVSTETESDGSYVLSGVKTGTVGFTMVKNGYFAMTMVCNADEIYFNLFPSGIASYSKDCTLEAYLYRSNGSPASDTNIYTVNVANSIPVYGGSSGGSGNHVWVDSVSGTTTYYIAAEPDIGSTNLMSTTLNAGQTKTLSLTLEAGVGTIRSTLVTPSSIPNYWGGAFLHKKISGSYCYLQVNQGSKESGSTYRVRGCPGEYYFNALCATDEAGSYYQEHIPSLASGQTIELGSINLMEIPILTPPDTGTATPILAYASPEADLLYIVQVWNQSDPGTGWMAITTTTSVEFPPIPNTYDAAIQTGQTYTYYVSAYKFSEGMPNVNNFDLGVIFASETRYGCDSETSFTTSF